MTQDEAWLAKYNEAVTFIETDNRIFRRIVMRRVEGI